MEILSELIQVLAGISIIVLTLIVFIAVFLASIYLVAYFSKSQLRHAYR